MTPEQITAMVQALGFPICVSIALFFALVTVFKRYVTAATEHVEAVKQLASATSSHALRMEEISNASNAALSANTTSNRKLTEMIESRALCRADELAGVLRTKAG